jgi:Family of unknown function (DUF6994)
MLIDTSFDFRTDTPPGKGKDPDKDSPTLRRYHKLLWSKALPDGALFDLNDAKPRVYLHHHSELGEFWLSSDSVISKFTRWGFAKVHPELYTDEDNEAFVAIAYTIGGMRVFPGNQIDRKWTINQARGCLRKISDRLDLTLECVRRHYEGQSSPLGETLARYSAFFALFKNFRGYVDFFLLQDLVTDGCSAVTIFPPFDDFKTPSVPKDVETYREYRRRTIEFIEARNRRIERHAAASR